MNINIQDLPPAQMSADEWEKALDECFDAFPQLVPYPTTLSAAKTSTALKTSPAFRRPAPSRFTARPRSHAGSQRQPHPHVRYRRF
jgi:hypothetical protein